MYPGGTVIILSRAAAEWREATDLLTDRCGVRVLLAKTPADAAANLADLHIDLAIADDGPDGLKGVAFLARLKSTHPAVIRLLVIGAKAGLPAMASTEGAIYQFVRKPVDPEQLVLVVQRALEVKELQRRQRLLARDFRSADRATHGAWAEPARRGACLNFEKLVYVSEKMQALCELARDAAATDLPILIQGGAGTGKDLLAKAMHANSPRRGAPLIVQNCGAISDAHLHTAVFGASPASHADAGSGIAGLLGMAAGGTVLLDEISEASKAFQLSLLRYLDTGKLDTGKLDSRKPDTGKTGPAIAGGDAPAANVRIFAASSQPLKAMVASGSFRQDLYTRLSGFELELPALRDRPDDIPVLAVFLAQRYGSATGRGILGISAAALEKLAAYDFPGNVAELENEIRRMVALAKDGEYLTTRVMSPALLVAAGRNSSRPDAAFSPAGMTLKDKVENLEKHLLREALLRHKWNRSRVAEELGLSRVGLANKVRRYGLNEFR